jgi:predicted dehydrogenase
MRSSLIIGFGRAGRGLHERALRRLAHAQESATRKLFVLDPAEVSSSCACHDSITWLSGYADLSKLDPECVVHVCTPPAQRVEVVSQLAAAGLRRMIWEKPLASSPEEMKELMAICERDSLDVVVVGNFVSSMLTRRVQQIIGSGELGAAQRISFVQNKPRFGRTLTGRDHPTAFDIELPHSVGAALLLAGPAKLLSARCTDLRVGGKQVPWLGSARLSLAHANGVLSEFYSDLTSPVRKRSIEVSFDQYLVHGHYPVSEADSYAQLVVLDRRGQPRMSDIFLDDSFLTFMWEAYAYFEQGGPAPACNLALNSAIMDLLADAKAYAGVFRQPLQANADEGVLYAVR